MGHRVLLAGPFQLLREGLAAILRSSGEFEVAGQVAADSRAVATCAALRPDILVLEMGPHPFAALKILGEVGRLCPGLKRVVLTDSDGRGPALRAIQGGVDACLTLDAQAAELLEALRCVAGGRCYLGPSVAAHVVASLRESETPPALPKHPSEVLTSRELEVLRLMVQGLTSQEIGRRLSLGVETVRSYRKNLKRKLGAPNLARLIQTAAAAGLLDTGGFSSRASNPSTH